MVCLCSEKSEIVLEHDGRPMSIEIVSDLGGRVPIVVLVDELTMSQVEDVLDYLGNVRSDGSLVSEVVGPPVRPELPKFRWRPCGWSELRVVPRKDDSGPFFSGPYPYGCTLRNPAGVRNPRALTVLVVVPCVEGAAEAVAFDGAAITQVGP